MTAAREAALLVLYDVFKNGAYSNLALKKYLSGAKDMTAADKALVTNLVYGVISRHYTLLYVIKRYSKIKPKKLADYIRIILELGLYQLIYTDKIPDSAAVNESVKLAKRYGRNGSDRFVNAVLRSFCRDGCVIGYPEDETERLAVKYSYSADTVRLLCDSLGSERAERVMAALNEPAPLTLRANILKCDAQTLCGRLFAQGIEAWPCEGALVYSEGFDVGKNEMYNNGWFSVQDRAAYHAALALGAREGETVIDMCAAPGGKSTHIAELMRDSGRVIACDVHEHKIKLIADAAKRLGLSSIETRISDGTIQNDAFTGIADRVLCDVPCSGIGVIRRKPDIKLGRNDISRLPDLQLAILKNGAKYLKDNGVLVYSTCTINPAENGGVVDKFLNENGGFKKDFEKTYLPDTDNSDGFYVCRLVRA